MKEFHQLIEVIDKLLSPEGCPWDREQTLSSLRKCVLEEVHELIEAIDLEDRDKILEELGDLFFNAVFFCKVAEKENIFSTEDVLQQIIDKLIRRHPHVFGDAKIANTAELLVQWEKIKKEENGNGRKSVLDAIPSGYPALAHAQRALHLMKKASYADLPQNLDTPSFTDEASLGEALMNILVHAENLGINAELALKKTSSKQEKDFRSWEEIKHG